MLRQLRKIVVTTVLAGFIGATMVRLGPGFDVDVQDLDSRLSAASHEAIAARRAADRNIASFYWRFLTGMIHGDLGVSRSLNQPVSKLITERLTVTLASLGYGVLGGVALGFALGLATLAWRITGFSPAVSLLSGVGLSIPAAVLALLFLWAGASGRWAISLVVFPHVYRYAKNVLAARWSSPHVLTAIAKGLSPNRVMFAHVVLPAAPQLAAIAGVSITLAFGASIPIEVICDTPGIGQLAWQAALGRDLPLLSGITMLIAFFTITVNALADMFLETAR